MSKEAQDNELNTNKALHIADVSGSALSPIEWLQKEVYKRFGGETFLKVFANEFEKAKQMEKDLLNAR